MTGYLKELVTQDFYDFMEHWQNSFLDMELVAVAKVEVSNPRYWSVVEDISLDDDTLYEAVEQIERE